MPALVHRAAFMSAAAFTLLSAGCSTTTPATRVTDYQVAGPDILANRVFGIPDWVRVISADPFVIDRKSFGPGDIVPVAVSLKQPAAANYFLISYTTSSPLSPASRLFEKVQEIYLTDPAEPRSSFSFALRVNPAAQLPTTPTTVTITVIGEENGVTTRATSNSFIVKR